MKTVLPTRLLHITNSINPNISVYDLGAYFRWEIIPFNLHLRDYIRYWTSYSIITCLWIRSQSSEQLAS